MTLKKCYDLVSLIRGENVEPYEVIECVEADRNFWRPEKVHTILLAESHVYTDSNDCIKMEPSFQVPKILEDAPSRFSRFVYCLGYGEAEYIGKTLLSNPGTWQYWKIFSSCIHEPSPESFSKILKKHTPESRILAKSELLSKLRDNGIWLLDASIVALYEPGKVKPKANMRRKIIECCWENYIRGQIMKENSSSILVIGKGVYDLLKHKLDELQRENLLKREQSLKIDWVRQPQGCRSGESINEMHRKIYDHCKDARLVSNLTKMGLQ